MLTTIKGTISDVAATVADEKPKEESLFVKPVKYCQVDSKLILILRTKILISVWYNIAVQAIVRLKDNNGSLCHIHSAHKILKTPKAVWLL